MTEETEIFDCIFPNPKSNNTRGTKVTELPNPINTQNWVPKNPPPPFDTAQFDGDIDQITTLKNTHSI